MIQAEMGSAACNAEGQLPRKGLRIRDFELWGRDGKSVKFSDFRDRYNLVLLFLGTPNEEIYAFAEEVAERAAEIEKRDARILMAFTAPAENLTRIHDHPHVMVLTDIDSRVHTEVGAVNGRACYITDRYGEVFAAFRTAEGNVMPTVKEMIEWLDFIEEQCPECETPEWPFDAA